MGETLVERIRRRPDDVGRRIEIRLADFEMNDVASFRFERPRFHQDFERGLRPETRHSPGQTKFGGRIHPVFSRWRSYAKIVALAIPPVHALSNLSGPGCSSAFVTPGAPISVGGKCSSPLRRMGNFRGARASIGRGVL